MIRVSKIAHASYETPDLDQQTEYYTDIIGLTLAAKEKDKAYLASTVDHHSVVLQRGPTAECVRLGFQIATDADLGEFEKQVAAPRRQDDAARRIRSRRSPTWSPSPIRRARSWRCSSATPSRTRNSSSKGIVPHKLGHVAFHVTDVKHVTKFYCDVLGFRESDWMADFFSFLRCGPDHHTINLMETGSNRHFHTAFELRDWGHMHEACDFLSLNGYKLLWGPGRHGIGHNLFAYHRAPNGLITETFAELDRINEELGYFEPRPWHRDNPQRPKVWEKDPSASNLVGRHAGRRDDAVRSLSASGGERRSPGERPC